MDWPSHAYLPGRNARHPEGAFDGLKILADPLRDSPAWSAGLRLMRARFYWEAHEVLEAVWMAAPERSGEKAAVQAVIQIANAALKARMGQDRAVSRLEGIARGLLEEAARLDGLRAMGMTEADLAGLRDLVRRESDADDAI